MSLGIAEESVDVPALDRSAACTLTISPEPGTTVSTSRCGVHDTDVLFDRIAQARALSVERLDGSAPILVERLVDETDAQWVTRVLTVVLPQVGEAQIACNLVAAAFERWVVAPVRIELRPEDSDSSPPPSPDPQNEPWYRQTRETPLMHSAAGVWVLVDSSGTLDPDADVPELVAALARRLCEVEALTARQQNALRRELARAVSHGDAQRFVDAAAQLVDGPVCLKDSTGSIAAVSDQAVAKNFTHEATLRDENGLRGTLLVQAARPADTASADLDLADLALALLRVRYATSECQILENRLAVMSYFVDRDVDGSRPEPVERSHRLVMIRSASRPCRSSELLVARVLEAASTVPGFSGLSLVSRPDAILGAYSDNGNPPESHHQNWASVLHAVDKTDSLRVVVSDAVASSKRNHRQHAAIEQISHLQQDDSGYFALPPVVVFDHLGPLAGVLHAVPGQQIVPYVRRVLGDLITDDRFGGQLIETLYAYLQTGGSPSGAGALLHLHGSSVKYRMRVVRELLGDRLDDPNKRFDLELALRLYLAGRSLTDKLAS